MPSDAHSIHRARFRTAAILRWCATVMFIIGPFAAMIIWERRTEGWAHWPSGPFYYTQPILMLAVLWGPATLIALRTHHIARWIHPVFPAKPPAPPAATRSAA